MYKPSSLDAMPKNGTTAVYTNKDGQRYTVFHRTPGGVSWQHGYDERCPSCPVSPKGRI